MIKQFTIVGINADGNKVYRMQAAGLPDELVGIIAYERNRCLDCGAVRVVIDIAE